MVKAGSTITIQLPAWFAKEHDLPLELEGQVVSETEKAVQFKGRIPAVRRTHCAICGHELTHPTSLVVGVGPICAERIGIDRSRYESMSPEELLQLLGEIEFKAWIPKSVLGMGAAPEPVMRAPQPSRTITVDLDRLATVLASKPAAPASKSASSLADKVERIFRETFAAKLPGYEPREPQIRMARTVAEGLSSGRHVLCEAGTGTGKSFAVLVPAILHSLEVGKPVIVTTGTIALQEQYVRKDIPVLQRIMGEPFTAVLAKGKGNYVCKLRLGEEVGKLDLYGPDPLIEWALKTETGDIADYPDNPDPVRWNEINVDDTCIGRKCPFYDSCHYFAAKRRANDAQVVIANHHLFFADLQIKVATGGYGGVLPKGAAVIFDEAHHLESVARDTLGTQITNFQIPSWIRAVRKLPVLIDPDHFSALEKANEAFFFDLAGRMEEDRQDIPEPSTDLGANLRAALRKVVDSLDSQRSNLSEEDNERAGKLIDRANAFLDLLAIAQRETSAPDNWVEWIEREQRRDGQWKVTIHSTPIDVAPILSEHLFGAYDSVVLTSATISVGGKFDHIRRRLGVPSALELIVDSPFDYRSNCLLYVPRPETAPNPAGNNPDYHRQIAPIIEEILLRTDGRAFVLFTSYRGMQIVYDELADRLRWQVLKQGDAPRSVLIERFKQDGRAVLFGTKTFWEGISVEGEALSCVIIDKLPFSVPSDPVTKAIAAAVERQGKSAFYEISLPEAVLQIKQGFGRLIRTKSDRGIVAILDTRIRTKPYGRVFLDSLPRARRIETLDNVEAFLGAGKGNAA